MSAEIVKHQPAASLPDMVRYAEQLANANLLPGQYRKQPANVLYAMEYGRTLGITPLAAITGIHVIEGKPSASAALISGLVRQAGHKLRVRGNDTQAWAQIIRADDPDYDGYQVTWTMDRARQAGLANKDVWRKYPAAMLKARAITEVARDACEEVLFGLHYTPEELGANVSEDGFPMEAPVQQLRRVSPGESDPWETSRSAAPGAWAGTATPVVAPEQRIATDAAECTDAACIRDLYREAQSAGVLAATVKVGGETTELGAYLIGQGKRFAEPSPEPAPAADEVVDAEVVEEPEQPADEHAAAVAELQQFAADNGIPDIEAAAYPHLGAPLDDVAPAAIRNLTQQLRASAA